MAIGERIHHFRLLRGFTQKYLGQQLGFSESQADVRIAQYEKGARSPKENYLNALADIFDVSPHALAVPDIDSYVGLMHTLFTLEDLYGLHIGEIDGELCLRLDKSKGTTYLSMFDMFHAWQEQAEKLLTYQAKGYGLKNVNDRMQLLYGMEYGIKVFSQIDQGTRVEMRIPREKADEEAVAAGEFSAKKFLQEPEEDTEDTTGKKGGKSEEKK